MGVRAFKPDPLLEMPQVWGAGESLMEFYRAELPYYTCGFWVDDDRIIVDAAPIMHWAIGRTLNSFVKWAKTRRGVVQLIGQEGGALVIPNRESLFTGR